MIAAAIIQEMWGDELRELFMKINQHASNLFERIKSFFAGIWQKLKSIKDLLEYLLDDDLNYALQCRYKRSLESGDCMVERKKIIFEREKRVNCYA